jgi:hypothetical protein
MAEVDLRLICDFLFLIPHFFSAQAMFVPEFWDCEENRELLGDCSLVVGLHPDQVGISAILP